MLASACLPRRVLPAFVFGILLFAGLKAHAQQNPSGSPVADTIVDDPTLGGLETSVGLAIENLCPQLVARTGAGTNTPVQLDLQVRCTELVQAGIRGEGLRGILRQATAEEVATQGTGAVELAGVQLARIHTRLAALRVAQLGGAPVLAFNERAGLLSFAMGGGSAGDETFGRWSVYANGELSTGDKDGTANEAGFDFDSVALTGGADYRLSDSTFVGGNLAYRSTDADLSNGGRVETDGYALAFYGTSYQDNGWYLEGTAGFGATDYDQQRNIRYTTAGVGNVGVTSVNQVARADTEGKQFFASIGAGKESVRGPVTTSFSANLDYLDADVDGFAERVDNANSGFGMTIEVDDQQIRSLRSTLAIQISKAISTKQGVVAPFGRLEWIHQFDDEARAIRARFVNDPFSVGFNQTNGTYPPGAPAVTPGGNPVPTIFVLPTDDPDQNYFRLSIGGSAVFAGGGQAFIALDAILGLDDVSHTALTVGFRKELR